MLISSSPIINNNFNILKTKNLNLQGKSVSTPPKNPTLNQAGANISFCAGYKGLNTLSECRNTARALGIKVFDVHDLEIAQVILGGFKNMRNKLKRTDIFPEIVELYKRQNNPAKMAEVELNLSDDACSVLRAVLNKDIGPVDEIVSESGKIERIDEPPMISLSLNEEFFRKLPERNAQNLADVENLVASAINPERTFVPNKLLSKLNVPKNPSIMPLEYELERAAILETIINNTLLMKKEPLYVIDRTLTHSSIEPKVAHLDYNKAVYGENSENMLHSLLGIYQKHFWDKNIDVPLIVAEQDKFSALNRAVVDYNIECANFKLFSSYAEREEEYLEDFSATFSALPYVPVYKKTLKDVLGYSFDAQLKGKNLPDDLKNLFHNNGISHLLVPDVASK